MSSQQITLPAGYAPAFAIGYADSNGELAIIDSGTPLPVSLSGSDPVLVQAVSQNAPAPLAGQANASTVAGPYDPVADKPLLIQLSGIWQGTIQIERSVDGGNTRHPLTAGGMPWGRFSGNVCEVVWSEQESGAELFLNIALTSGTVDYRLSQ